jgi:peptide/nickel transport system substrate-binding protein
MKRFSIAAAALAAALTIACGGGSEKSAGGAGDTAGKPLVIAFDTSPTNLDARVGADQASGRVFDLVYAGLVKFTPESGHAPDLAEKWEIAPDGKTLTFHLRPNLKFQDGRPLTAKDVEFTYTSMMAESFNSPKKSGYASVASFKAVDDRTFVITMNEPNAGMLDNLTVGIVPQGADANAFKTKPIGAGPYKVVEFRPDDRVVLQGFDGYHGGAPKIRDVTIRIIPDATTRVLELRNGSIDFVLNAVPYDMVPRFTSGGEFQVIEEPGSAYQYLAFNMRDPILKDVRVRRAVAHGIDRERIVKDLLLGHGRIAESMLPAAHWAGATNLPTYPYDVNRAKQLLDEAGRRDPDGDGPQPRFKLVYKTSTDAEANQQAQMIQQMLRQIGVEVEIQSNEFGTFLEDVQKGNFQLFSLRRAGVADPDFYSAIFSQEALPPEGQNRGYYVNPELDRLLEQARATFDQGQRKQLYQQVQQTLATDLPYVSLYHRANIAIMKKGLTGFEMYPSGFLLSVPKMSWTN